MATAKNTEAAAEKPKKQPKDRGSLIMEIVQVLIKTFTSMLGSSSGNPNLQAEFITSKATSEVKAMEEIAGVEAATGLKASNAALKAMVAKIKGENYEPTEEDFTELRDAMAEENVEKSKTVFMKDPETKRLHLLDYQIVGFLKEKVSHLSEIGGVPATINAWSLKTAVNAFVYVVPRKIWLIKKDAHPLDYLKYNEGDMLYQPTFPGAPEESFFYHDPTSERVRPLQAETRQGKRVALANSAELEEGVQMVLTFVLFTNDKSRLAPMGYEHLIRILNRGAQIGLLQWRSGGFGRFKYQILKRITLSGPEAMRYLDEPLYGNAIIVPPAKPA